MIRKSEFLKGTLKHYLWIYAEKTKFLLYMQVIPPYKDKTLFKAQPLKFQCKSRHAISQSWWWNITEKSTFARELIRISRDVRTGDNLLWWLSVQVYKKGKIIFSLTN